MTWLTIPEAAKRVDRTERTIRSWIAQGDVRIAFRRIREDDLIEVDRRKRAARSKGRPRAAEAPAAQIGSRSGVGE